MIYLIHTIIDGKDRWHIEKDAFAYDISDAHKYKTTDNANKALVKLKNMNLGLTYDIQAIETK